MTCFECGAPADHQHHVVPRSLGGTKTISLCHGCHGKAHGRERGFHNTGELARAALRAKRARGEAFNHAPYGYRVEDGRLVHDDAEQAVIAAVRDLRARKVTLRAIVTTLEARGVLSRAGTALGLTQVARIASDIDTDGGRA